MNIKTTKFIFIFLLSSLVTSVHAIDWADGPFDTLQKNVSTVKTNVSTIKDNITGNISTVSDELKKQVDTLVNKGVLLKDTAEQLLDWLNSHKEGYLTFVGSSPRCGSNSPCGNFRTEVRTFIQDFSGLSDRFPIIEKIGMSDAPLIIKLIDNMPPIMIFTLYETMARIPDWNTLPDKLTNIFDEIGDPNVFSVDLAPRASTSSASSGFSLAAFNFRTPTQRFCDNKADNLDNGIDPVRLNRIKLSISFIKTGMSIIGEVPPKDQSVDILGEGGSLPVPNIFKMIVHTVNWVQEAVQTYRDNINICRDIRDKNLARELTLEVQIADCLQLVEFIMPGTRDDVYNLVDTKIENARTEGIDVDNADASMAEADRFRNKDKWRSAYLKICEAYRKIGK